MAWGLWIIIIVIKMCVIIQRILYAITTVDVNEVVTFLELYIKSIVVKLT